MDKEKNFYKMLEIEEDANEKEIKIAYKRLAKKYHPDVNKDEGAAEKFKEISEAASVLGDDEKRAQYDNYGSTYEDITGTGFDFRDFGFDFGGFGESIFDFGDIFDRFFGTGFGFGRREKRKRRGSDLRYDLEITLEEAASGTKKTISIPKLEKCSVCNGTGAESDSDIVTCPECGGSGIQKRTQRTPFGIISTSTTCRKCGGQGRYIKNECRECDGTGVVRIKKNIEIKIPAGAEEGTNLRITGEGEAGQKGAEPGDLYVILHIEEHDVFEIKGDDIYVKVTIPFTLATLGGEIEVPTLEGKAKLKIPAGTQNNTVFRMRNKGLPHLHGSGSGSELVEVVVKVPTKLTKKQKDLLKDFEKESKRKGFFKKVF